MSKQNLKKQILEKIKKGEVKMKPKWYFVLGSLLLFIGFLLATMSSIFIFNLILFLLRTHYGPMYQYRLQMILLNYPWWLILIGFLSIFFGVRLLKEYDFSYKKNFWFLVLGYILIIFLSAYIIDYFNLNRFFTRGGFMKRFYQNERQYFYKNKNFKGPGFLK
ncbi:MAG: hypothetical protein Fur009_1010 [Candidatus Microgenomates bacterium]